ncbi:MAG: hypothetical protein HZA03_02810 [Nitrospinae bacterium]|nr:hypothetical protein [Nitrospinota bacterium]
MGVRALTALLLALITFIAAPVHGAEAREAAHGGFQVKGLAFPRGFIVDEATGYYYIANLNGRQLSKGNRGFITRLNPDGALAELKFIQGKKGGITLHAPKGLLIDGDLLYISDIDHVVVADKNSGAFVASVDLAAHGAQYLADMARGPKGRIYVCDTIGSRIFILDPARNYEVSVFASGKDLDSPSAIAYSPKLDKFLVTLASGHVGAIDMAGKVDPKFINVGSRNLVGMDIDDEGHIYVVSFTHGRVMQMDNLGQGQKRILGEKLNTPGSLFVDRKNREILIPLTLSHRLISLDY